MKKLLPVLPLFFLLVFLMGNCKNHQFSSDLPKILNPTYKMYEIKGERGYNVSFLLDKTEPEAVAVVINGMKKNIIPSEKRGNQYFVNINSQTQKIEGYKVETVDKPNGIYFKSDKEPIFKKVKFQLIP